MGINMKTRIKKLVSILLVGMILFSNVTMSLAIGETVSQSYEESLTKTYYRYREKSTMGQPYQINEIFPSESEWTLYKIEPYREYCQRENGYILDYYTLVAANAITYERVKYYETSYSWDPNLVIDYEYLCVGYVYNTKYDGSGVDYEFTYKLTIPVTDSSGRTYYEYSGKKLYYQGTCRLYNLVVYSEYYYYYYKWSAWSEWSETPITETEDCEVETRYVYTVSYDANGGEEVPQAQSKIENENIAITEDIPVREGYSFVGWSTSVDGDIEYNPGDTYSSNGSITLYAIWDANTYVISFDTNGGSNAPLSQTKTHDVGLIISSEVPVREGYTFLGWAITADGNAEYTPGDTYMQNENVTLYASWEILQQDSSTIVASGMCGENLKWTLSKDGTLVVSGTGRMTDWYSSTYTNAPWYSYRETIKKVIIEDGVENIGSYAFYKYYYIESVEIGNSVSEIGQWSFVQTDIVTLHIPSTVEYIGPAAFHYCDELIEVTFENSLKISADTFDLCQRIAVVNVPDVETWCQMIFMGTYANPLCYGDLYIGGVLTTDIVIPSSIESISYMTFKGYKNLTTVCIPASIDCIESFAFDGCDGLTDVYYEGDAKQWDAITIESYNEKLIVANLHTTETVLNFSGASLALHHNLTINYKVDKALFDTQGYSKPYVIFEFNGEKKTVDIYSTEGERYVFSFCDIAPNQMNDTISATLFATYDGVEYSSETKEYSVATYCYNMLEKCSGDEYAEFRTLLVDLLHYGAASQVYTNYKTDALVDAQLTATQLSWGTSSDRTLENVLDTTYETVADPSVVWKGAGLNLQDSVTVRLKFETAATEGLSLRIISQTGSWEISNDAFESAGDVYYAYFRGLNAGQMSEPIYMTFYRNNTPVSNTVCYSIESYAQANQNGGTTALVELLKAMMRYGDSAYAYVN